MPVMIRYIIDLSILFGTVCTVWLCMPETKSNFTLEDYREYDRSINRYFWDRYGPGADREYAQFRSEIKDMTQLSEGFQTLLSLVNLVNCSEQIMMNSAFDVPYRLDWEKVDLYLDRYLQFIEENGPLLIPPKETFRIEEVGPAEYQWWIDRTMIRINRLRIEYDWQIGNYDAAVQRIDKLIRLCRAFRYHPGSVQFEYPKLIYEILNIPDDLIWQSRDSKADVAMLEGLERIRAYDWDVPPQFGMLQLYSGFHDEHIFDRSIMEHEVYCAAYLASKRTEELMASPTAELIKSLDVVSPAYHFTVLPLNPADRTYIRLCQWTGIRAMRRRVPHLSEEYYQSDPVLPVALAKKIPPLIYLSSRYDREVIWPKKKFNEKTLIDLRLSAYHARVWRDEKSAWPTPEEFKQLLSDGSNLEWRIETDPKPFVERFAEDFRILPSYASIYRGSVPEEYTFRDDHPVIWIEEYPERLTYLFDSSLVWDDTSEGKLPPEIKRNLVLMFNCVTALFKSLQPLVKSTCWRIPDDSLLRDSISDAGGWSFGGYQGSIRNLPISDNIERIEKKRVEFIVEFSLPKYFYWVVDPNNNKTKILAGWE